MSADPQLPVVTLYSKPDCHLCEVARERIAGVQKQVPFALETVDITGDPALYEQYKERIPVVLVNGEEAFVYRVSEKYLARKLRALSPRESLWARMKGRGSR